MDIHPDDANFFRHIGPLRRVASGETLRPEQLQCVAAESAYAFRKVRGFLLEIADAHGPHAADARRLLATSGLEGAVE